MKRDMETIRQILIVVAGFLLCANPSNAQSSPYPALKIAPLGNHKFSLTITNGIGGENYEILWTPVLDDVMDYPWTSVAAGNSGQTSFVVNMGVYRMGFFEADIIPSWEVGSGIVAWWRANQIGLPNGAAVTNWTDHDGNVLQGTATFDAFGMNGYSAVDFNRNANNALSNSVILQNHPSLTNCGTIFVMFSWAAPASPPGFESIFNCEISNNAAAFTLTPSEESSSGMNTLEDGWRGFSSGGGNIAFDACPYDCEHLWTMTWSNGNWQDYIDGKLMNNYPNGAYYPATPTWPIPIAGSLFIGNNYNLSVPYQGSVSEIGITTNYWNFQTVDANANYILKSCDMLRPTIVLYGDSMIWGGSPSWGGGLINYLATNLPGWTIDDCGVPGATSAGVLSNYLYMANYSTANTYKIDFFWDNLNNDGVGIGYLNGITNNLYECANLSLANGNIPVLVAPPSNPLTDTNGERFVFESTMTNNLEAFQNLCNLSLNPNVGFSNAWTNATYYAVVGGPHFTNAGNATVSTQFISTIEQLTGY